MRLLLLFCLYSFLILGGMALLTSSGQASPDISVERNTIRARLDNNRVDITLPLQSKAVTPLPATVTVSIEDLQGTSIGVSSAQLNIAPGGTMAAFVVNAAIDAEQLPAYILHYTIEQENDILLEGKKSLFYAVRQIETRLLMQRQFYAGSQAAVRVVVNDPGANEGIADAQVKLTLDEQDIFWSNTDENGSLNAQFMLPEDVIGNHHLIVSVSVDGAEDIIRQPIQIKDVYKILLTTDKPLYQPGQLIHIRSLALRRPTLLPAGEQALLFEVEDSKGNKVFKQAGTTNDFGIGSAEFQLASELNEGTYRIRAIMGDNSVEKTVTVERYVLPKFNPVLTTDRRYYQPGHTLKGELQVDYFFGKPVTNGTVIVTASKFDVEFEKFAEVKGKTDDNGHYQFELQLPEHFVGQPLEQGNAFVKLDVSVVDTAEHEETKTLTRTVAADPLNVVVVPESGSVVPAVENILYVAVSYPDGSPAEVNLKAAFAGEDAHTLHTDASGIGELRVTPHEQMLSLTIEAQDAAGNRAVKSFQFSADGYLDQILLRTDKALYQVGDTMALDIFSNKASGTVYLDIIKDGQTFLTEAVELEDGHATLDVEAAVAGALQLHAYQILSSSDIIRDTKLVYVDAADELQIAFNTAKPSYLPGEEAQINFQVTNAQGHPVLAALGVSIVDESVFALQEMQPGLEKIYFMLEQEIMTPRYEIHGYSMEQVVTDGIEAQAVRDKAAQVLLASAENLVEYDVNVNTFTEKINSVRPLIQEKVMDDFRTIYQAIERFSHDRQKALTAKEGLQTLLDEKLLKPEDLLDPWGNPYQVQPGGDDFTYHSFLCIGPDEQEGSPDDIWFDAYIDIQAKTSFWDWLFGRRDRRAKGVMEDGVVLRGPVPPQPEFAAGNVVLEEAEMMLDMAASEPQTEADGGDAAPRIREYFPETLYVNPAILTDEQGQASIHLAMADSITTWRMTGMASSLTGALGSGTSAITVFQDFFVDIDLPVTLTQNDQVSIPIAIYNYLPGTQDVRLELTEAEWFELVDDIPKKVVTLKSGQVDVVYFTLKVKQIGWHKLTVHAYGSEMSDAIARSIEVLPDGEKVEATWNGRLSQDVQQVVTIPQDAIDDASKILVKVYPGIFSQIVEGLDAILRMPSGCFEQTSSTTYPNVLVLDYMKQVDQITPEIQMKAEGFINTGYQRLLSYEVDGGGFEWFGNAPAHNILTAYGLMEFYDMAQVHDVDPAVISRTQNWLAAQQQADGSWKPNQQYLDVVASKFADDVMRNTAYIAWALLATQYSGDTADKAIRYLHDHLDEVQDTYTLALIANALVLHDKDAAETAKLLETLLNKKQEEDGKIWWQADSATSTNASGTSADIETTALVALAFMQGEKYHDAVGKILTYLIESKDAYGTWHSTQATILAMKALILSIKNATSQTDAEVTLLVNGKEVEHFALTPENSDVMRLFDLKEQTVKGENQVQIRFDGDGSALYQIVGRFYLPWKQKGMDATAPMSIDVSYDKTELVKDDILTATVTVKNNRAERANMVIVDLGVPPGFEVQAGDLAEVVGDKTISKFSLTGRQIIVYLEYVDQDKPVEFSYRLKAKFPINAKTPASSVYEYYNPDVKNEALPQNIIVNEAEPAS